MQKTSDILYMFCMNIESVQLYKSGGVYSYYSVTLKKDELIVTAACKEFLERCIAIVEHHIDDYNFSVITLAREMGMSHSALYKKIKSASGQPVNAFIRSVRLRKAAEIMINSGHNINEVAAIVGFTNVKFFRQYFNELFGMKPSEYIKHYRKPFHITIHTIKA